MSVDTTKAVGGHPVAGTGTGAIHKSHPIPNAVTGVGTTVGIDTLKPLSQCYIMKGSTTTTTSSNNNRKSNNNNSVDTPVIKEELSAVVSMGMGMDASGQSLGVGVLGTNYNNGNTHSTDISRKRKLELDSESQYANTNTNTNINMTNVTKSTQNVTNATISHAISKSNSAAERLERTQAVVKKLKTDEGDILRSTCDALRLYLKYSQKTFATELAEVSNNTISVMHQTTVSCWQNYRTTYGSDYKVAPVVVQWLCKYRYALYVMYISR